MNHNTTLPEILPAKDLQTYFHLSRAGAYNLLNRADFPTLHVGKRKMVTRERLLQWMDKNTGRNTL